MSYRIWCTLAFAALVAALPSGGSEPSIKARIDAIVEPYLDAGDFMGVVGVQWDGKAAQILPYGFASVELQAPHRADSVFMIGSVSKQFTAVAVLVLEELGALTTADTVSRHLPSFPHGDAITIEQLLTHTSGVVDIFSLDSFGETAGRAGTFEELIVDLGGEDLSFVPGSGYAYSNGGYALLAAVIEKASGETYGDFLQSRFFAPLGMSDTAHDEPGPAVLSRVPGYDPWGRTGLSPTIPWVEAFTTGSGSLWSSAGDLLKWSTALHGGRVLSAASYAKLTRNYGRGYGFGVSVFERFGRPVIGHDGRIAGYASDLARYVDDRATIVVLSNVQSVVRDEIRRLLAAVVFGEEYTVPETRELAEPSPNRLAELVGVYSFGPGFEVSITESDGRLLARANQGGHSELVPTAAGDWFSRMLYATVRFGRSEEGEVDRLIWGAGEGAPSGRKVR